jgi:phosphoenolpyruvate-protein kinase (PTS system EI component)
MNLQAIPTVKAQIRRLTQERAKKVAQQALALTTVAAVEAFLATAG